MSEKQPSILERYWPHIGSAVAVAVSIAALGVSLVETSAQRTNMRASVWPYLEVTRHYGSDGFAYRASNKGVGPARVRWARMYHSGELISDLDQLIIETVGQENAFSYDLYNANNIDGDVLASGELRTLFGVPWEPRTRRLSELWFDTVTIDACYCSIYDECWIARLDEGDPEPVASCLL